MDFYSFLMDFQVFFIRAPFFVADMIVSISLYNGSSIPRFFDPVIGCNYLEVRVYAEGFDLLLPATVSVSVECKDRVEFILWIFLRAPGLPASIHLSIFPGQRFMGVSPACVVSLPVFETPEHVMMVMPMIPETFLFGILFSLAFPAGGDCCLDIIIQVGF
ncbi:hypothetical protein Mpet_0350 [Methanolacinia petrolearia DSM 11571]|uniref:Uncharacterized protein n=1 Tax=Methanolacinia petrolearia (strain DSM 11571 / OCM 486 / SEBR 4847) TaxID=679926 RepID=E1RFX2_METP4|nr:hypothetical protein Mpet_0350 [Methanolacinia petrolearia DSM 11571]